MQKIIISTLAFVAGAVLAGIIVKRLWKQKFTESQVIANADSNQKDLFYNWLVLKKRGDSIATRIKKLGADKIAVFGLEEAGRLLVDDLCDSGVTVEYAIELDNPSYVHEALEVYRLHDDELPKADLIVVCPPYDIKSAKLELQGQTNAEIVSLESLIIKEKNQ
jgi:hypoxanthine phosphoribosyltransferase